MSLDNDKYVIKFAYVRYSKQKDFESVNVKKIKNWDATNFDEHRMYLVKRSIDNKLHHAQIMFVADSIAELNKQIKGRSKRMQFVNSKIDQSLSQEDEEDSDCKVKKKKPKKNSNNQRFKRETQKENLKKKLIKLNKTDLLGEKTPEKLSTPASVEKYLYFNKENKEVDEKYPAETTSTLNSAEIYDLSETDGKKTPKKVSTPTSVMKRLQFNVKYEKVDKKYSAATTSNSTFKETDNLSAIDEDNNENAIEEKQIKLHEDGDLERHVKTDSDANVVFMKKYKVFRSEKTNIKHVHLGEGVSITETAYEEIFHEQSCAKFVKMLSTAIWTREVLVNRYVKSNRPNSLVQIEGRSPRKQLTPKKEKVLRDCFNDFINNKKELPSHEKVKHLKKCGVYIGDEIKYLRTKMYPTTRINETHSSPREQ